MAYREVPPPRWLGGFAEARWQVRPRSDGPRHVLPDGCVDLLVVDGEPLIAGPDTVARLAGTSSPAGGVRFAPGALPALPGAPAVELRDLRVPLVELHPALARRARRSLDDAAPTRVLTDVCAALMPRQDPVERVWSAGVRAAAAAGYSDQPHLSREVRAPSGMAPGQLADRSHRPG